MNNRKSYLTSMIHPFDKYNKNKYKLGLSYHYTCLQDIYFILTL